MPAGQEVVKEVWGANFHGFIFLCAREDEIFVNFKLGNLKMTESKNLSKPR